ncbi:MAG: heavy metal translocating P-type ATPase [Bacteroidota bacterium]
MKRYFDHPDFIKLVSTVISGIFLALSWAGWLKQILPFDAAWVAIVLSGAPILATAFQGIIKRFDIMAGLLVSIALIASVAIGEYFAAGEVAFIMMIGELLENWTVRKAKEGIEKLVRIAPQMARIRTENGEREIPATEVKVGDTLLIKPGETIPVDGRIIKGQTTVNQAVITGESLPVDKTVNDEVYVGTLNQFGTIEVAAIKVGEDTSLAKLIRLVKEAENKKAPVVRIADRWATIIVPVALACSIVVYLLTSDITRAVTILVVFCPCALVLATPAAIMAGIGNASRKGILIKSGEALEKMGRINLIAFDKTGTITCGKPEVTRIISLEPNYPEEVVLQLAASAESFSEHPLGQAIVMKARENSISIIDPNDFQLVLGRGITAKVGSDQIMVGNRDLLKSNHIEISNAVSQQITSYENDGNTVMVVVVNQKPAGLIMVADRMKCTVPEAIRELKAQCSQEVLLLTGDNQNTARSIAEQAQIERVYAGQLPEGKVAVIEEQMKQGKKVCMIGDGINDAPALATAEVGIAMGVLGSDVAIETADIALMSDDINKIPQLIRLAKKVLRTVTQNIWISMGINFGAIILASAGLMGPVVGALVHNLGSVLVVLNSAAVLRYKG